MAVINMKWGKGITENTSYEIFRDMYLTSGSIDSCPTADQVLIEGTKKFKEYLDGCTNSMTYKEQALTAIDACYKYMLKMIDTRLIDLKIEPYDETIVLDWGYDVLIRTGLKYNSNEPDGYAFTLYNPGACFNTTTKTELKKLYDKGLIDGIDYDNQYSLKGFLIPPGNDVTYLSSKSSAPSTIGASTNNVDGIYRDLNLSYINNSKPASGYLRFSSGFEILVQSVSLKELRVSCRFSSLGNYSVISGQADSGEAGGDGTMDASSDNIEVPVLPTASAVNSGLITLYNPTKDELINLSEYLWSNNIIDVIGKMFNNPLNVIVALNICNVKPEISANKYNAKLGGITTKVKMNTVEKQYVEVDCGDIFVNKYWGSFLDYNPHTKIELYLPYIGFINLNPDEVMGRAVNIKYYIDMLTGNCQCYISVTGENYTAVIQTHTGNCFTQLPLSAGNYDAVKQSAMFAIGAVAVGAVTGGAGAVAGGAGAGAASASAGALVPYGTTTAGAVSSKAIEKAAMAGAKKGIAVSGAVSVGLSKSKFMRSGSASSAMALMNIKKPYMIITRPALSLPKDFNKFNGYPSNITSKLSDLTGYTEVDRVHITGFDCTDDEKDMIEALLTGGVFL